MPFQLPQGRGKDLPEQLEPELPLEPLSCIAQRVLRCDIAEKIDCEQAEKLEQGGRCLRRGQRDRAMDESHQGGEGGARGDAPDEREDQAPAGVMSEDPTDFH